MCFGVDKAVCKVSEQRGKRKFAKPYYYFVSGSNITGKAQEHKLNNNKRVIENTFMSFRYRDTHTRFKSSMFIENREWKKVQKTSSLSQ